MYFPCWSTAYRSFRPVEAVACVAEAGDDVPLLVQVRVDRGDDDVDVGVVLLDVAHSFGRGDQGDQGDVRRAGVLQRCHGCGGRVAGGEHRVEEEHLAVGDVGGQLDV